MNIFFLFILFQITFSQEQSDIPEQEKTKELSQEEIQKQQRDRRARERQCNPDLPNLSVGDFNITQKNYDRIKKENEVMIIGASDIQCDTCCFTEGLLNLIQHEMETIQHKYKNKRIKIGRLDLFQNVQLTQREREKLQRIPAIFVYKNEEWYQYKSYYMKGLFLHFINRILNPVVYLKQYEDIIQFLNTEQEFEENNEFYINKYEKIGDYYHRMGLRTRVIAFFNDKKEYKNEYNLFKQAAQNLAERDDLRVGLVKDSQLVKQIKSEYGQKFFDGFSLNSMVLIKNKDQIFTYNLEEDSQDIEFWINKMSLSKFGEYMNKESQFIAKHITQPYGVLFLNQNQANQKEFIDSKIAKSGLQRVAPYYYDRFNFLIIESDDAREGKHQYGITWDTLPAFSIMTPSNNYFPIQSIINLGNEDTIDKIFIDHLDNFIYGRLQMPNMQSKINFNQKRDNFLFEKMSNIKTLSKDNFKGIVLAEEHDVLVLFFNSDKDSEYNKLTHQIVYNLDTCALKLRKNKIKSVLIGQYDTFANGFIDYMEKKIEKPQIYLFKAQSNKKVIYSQKSYSVQQLLAFIQENVEVKFRLSKKDEL